ncbi:MAG: hypothetical protein WAV48_06685, partial [Candidatus Magasanikiibacteriota bacterium]
HTGRWIQRHQGRRSSWIRGIVVWLEIVELTFQSLLCLPPVIVSGLFFADHAFADGNATIIVNTAFCGFPVLQDEIFDNLKVIFISSIHNVNYDFFIAGAMSFNDYLGSHGADPWAGGDWIIGDGNGLFKSD